MKVIEKLYTYRKIVTLGLFATVWNVQAQESNDISHSFFEVGYGAIDRIQKTNIFYIEGQVEINDHFTLGGETWTIDNRGVINLEHYELNFGFQNNITAKTDFFTKLHYGHEETGLNDIEVYGLALGTKTTLGTHFELQTELKHSEYRNSSGDYFTAEVKGLYKFNVNHGMSFTVKNWDGDNTGLEVGYRYSF